MVVEAQKVNSDYQNSKGTSDEKIEHVLNELNKRLDSVDRTIDSTNSKYKYYDSLISKLSNNGIDSANKIRKDLVFRAMSRWEIPIGYNREDAPLSWIKNNTNSIKDYRNTAQENVLIEYFESRNQRTFWGIVKWIIGILISGIALGYGAPFWFDTLNKLINIRNAGQKPLKMNQNK